MAETVFVPRLILIKLATFKLVFDFKKRLLLDSGNGTLHT